MPKDIKTGFYHFPEFATNESCLEMQGKQKEAVFLDSLSLNISAENWRLHIFNEPVEGF